MNNVLVEIDGLVEAQEQNLADAAAGNAFSEYTTDGRISSCWVCTSENTRMVYSRGYGIVHECNDCSDRFPDAGVIQWSM